MTTFDRYLRDPHLGTCVDKRTHGRHTLRTSWGEFGCPGWPRPRADQQPAPADPTAAPQPAPCWVHAGGDAPCRCFDEPPAPQPATPGQALRWAAQRLNGVPATLTADTLLRRWADELDAGKHPAPGPDPATPCQPDLNAASELAEAADAVRADLELEQALHEIVRRAHNPYGDLAGMMRTPEAAAAVVAVLNAQAEGGTDAR